MEPTELDVSRYESISELWKRCLGERWPISDDDLKLYLFNEIKGIPKVNLGFVRGERVVAMASSHRSGLQAGLLLVLVDPDYQRRGLGRRLITKAAERHHAAGVRGIKVGSVGCGFLWPGIPDASPETRLFFEGLGFRTGSMYSLVLDASTHSPSAVWPEQVSIRPLEKEEASALMAMQARCAFGWENDFARPISKGRHRDIIVAVSEGSILGALTIRGPDCHHLWRRKLGDKMGEIDNVGVDKAHRNQGIGLGLVDYATQTMRDRGVAKILIGNTWLKDWYGRLGYRVWSEWYTCKASLPLD